VAVELVDVGASLEAFTPTDVAFERFGGVVLQKVFPQETCRTVRIATLSARVRRCKVGL